MVGIPNRAASSIAGSEVQLTQDEDEAVNSLIGRCPPWHANFIAWTLYPTLRQHFRALSFPDCSWSFHESSRPLCRPRLGASILTVCLFQLALNNPLRANFDNNHVLFCLDHLSPRLPVCDWGYWPARQHYWLYFQDLHYKCSHSVMSMRFWKNDSLLKCQVCRYTSTTGLIARNLPSIAKVLSAFSTAPYVVCLSGWSLATLRTLDTSTLVNKKVEYPFRFNALSLSLCPHWCIANREVFLVELTSIHNWSIQLRSSVAAKTNLGSSIHQNCPR